MGPPYRLRIVPQPPDVVDGVDMGFVKDSFVDDTTQAIDTVKITHDQPQLGYGNSLKFCEMLVRR